MIAGATHRDRRDESEDAFASSGESRRSRTPRPRRCSSPACSVSGGRGPAPESAIVESHRTAVNQAGERHLDVAALFEPPPVDSLDVLARQQSGYVVVLNRMGKE